MYSIERFATAIDCEGSIGINRMKSSETSSKPQFSARIYFGMIHPEIVQMFHAKFGGSFKVRKSVSGRFPIYSWSVVGNKKVKPILETLLPYLITKKAQAVNALALIAYIDSFPLVRKGIRGWTKETDLDVLNSYHRIGKELNHRAPAETERENPVMGCDSPNSYESMRVESEAVPPLA